MASFVESSGLVDGHRLIGLFVAQTVDDMDPTFLVVIYITA